MRSDPPPSDHGPSSGFSRFRAGGAFLKRLTLFFAASVLALVVGELLLRAMGFYGVRTARVSHIQPVDDPVLDHRLTPNTSWIFNGIPYATNARGWRDHDYAYEKQPGVHRILVLGDSVLNGHGVRMEQVFAKRLEERLNADPGGQEHEVIMLAMGALNTVQEAHLLETEGLRYMPDLVVLSYVLNDPDPSVSLARRSSAKVEIWPKIKLTLKNSSLVFYSVRLAKKMLWKTLVSIGDQDSSTYIEHDLFGALHQDSEKWQQVTGAFSRIRSLTEPAGIKVVVVVFPVFYELENYPWHWVHSLVEKASRDQGFLVLDLIDVFAETPDHTVRLGRGDHIHPNALGHEIAGTALYSFLHESRLLGSRQSHDYALE